MMRRRLSRAVCALAGVILAASLAGCSKGPDLPPSFSVLTGQQVKQNVETLKGDVVVLNFWATWCVPCREEFPSLVRLDEAYRSKGVRVIAVSVDDVEDIDGKVKPFVRESGAKFPVWVKSPGDPERFMDAISPRISGAVPETMIYDRTGKLVQMLAGEQTYEGFEAAVKAHL